MAIGKKTGGRQKGTPNKSTADVKAAIAAFASGNVDRMATWLEKIETDDPAKAFELYLRAIEYHVPKLARSETTISDATDEELLAEVRRRREEAEGVNEPG